MGFLIDTNVFIELENKTKNIVEQVSAATNNSDERLYITLFSYAEFYFGFMNKDDKQKERAIKQLRDYNLLSASETTALIFCEILYYLRKKGKVIPHFDIMIAASAIEHDLTLITADKDFNHIPQLKKVILSL